MAAYLCFECGVQWLCCSQAWLGHRHHQGACELCRRWADHTVPTPQVIMANVLDTPLVLSLFSPHPVLFQLPVLALGPNFGSGLSS